MKIETKYNIQDKVYIMLDNKVVQKEVQIISVSVQGKTHNIYYQFDIDKHGPSNTFNGITRLEEQVFSTKDELLKTL